MHIEAQRAHPIRNPVEEWKQNKWKEKKWKQSAAEQFSFQAAAKAAGSGTCFVQNVIYGGFYAPGKKDIIGSL